MKWRGCATARDAPGETRARLHRADARGPRDPRPDRGARAARLLARRGGTRDPPVQPALAQLAEIRAGARPAWRRSATGEPSRYRPERIGMLSMLCVVVVFGAHSLIDWTWYVPGDAIAGALSAPAGWRDAARSARRAAAAAVEPRARGPGSSAAGAAATAGARRRRARLALAAAAIVAALLMAWSQWQPLRSEEAARSGARRSSRGEPARGAAATRSGGLTRPAVGRSAVRARRRAGGRRATAARRARRCQGGAAAALQPPDLARTGALRSRRATRARR